MGIRPPKPGNTRNFVDANNDGVDDRLDRWRAAIEQRLGRKVQVTDTLRSHEAQLVLHNRDPRGVPHPDAPGGAMHVQGRAMDISTRGFDLSPEQWKEIALAAARDIGLTGVFATAEPHGSGPHLHIQVGYNASHVPDGCANCTSTKNEFGTASNKATKDAQPGARPPIIRVSHPVMAEGSLAPSAFAKAMMNALGHTQHGRASKAEIASYRAMLGLDPAGGLDNALKQITQELREKVREFQKPAGKKLVHDGILGGKTAAYLGFGDIDAGIVMALLGRERKEGPKPAQTSEPVTISV